MTPSLSKSPFQEKLSEIVTSLQGVTEFSIAQLETIQRQNMLINKLTEMNNAAVKKYETLPLNKASTLHEGLDINATQIQILNEKFSLMYGLIEDLHKRFSTLSTHFSTICEGLMQDGISR